MSFQGEISSDIPEYDARPDHLDLVSRAISSGARGLIFRPVGVREESESAKETNKDHTTDMVTMREMILCLEERLVRSPSTIASHIG